MLEGCNKTLKEIPHTILINVLYMLAKYGETGVLDNIVTNNCSSILQYDSSCYQLQNNQIFFLSQNLQAI